MIFEADLAERLPKDLPEKVWFLGIGRDDRGFFFQLVSGPPQVTAHAADIFILDGAERLYIFDREIDFPEVKENLLAGKTISSMPGHCCNFWLVPIILDDWAEA